MIQMPRRSVTRFFIPLIDVMILLFCIFLLMPIFDEARKDEDNSSGNSSAAELRRGLDHSRLTKQLKVAQEKIGRLQQDMDPLTQKEREELSRLRKEKSRPLQDRFAVFVLGIDGKTGTLFYYEPADADTKVLVSSREAARKLIDHQKEEAGGREVYFLFRLPRGESRFPRPKDIERIDKDWFGSVRHGFDSPGEIP
jgi:hypothetical protein